MTRANSLVCLLLLFTACAQGGTGTPDSGPAPDVPGVPSTTCDPACEGSDVCVSGECMAMSVCGPDGMCPAGDSCCPSGCSTLPSDPANCGGCGRECGATGDTCMSGQCRCRGASACVDGEVCCEEGCTNLMESAENCGICGIACGEGEICEAGACVTPPCDPACTNDETCDVVTSTCMCGAGPTCEAGLACCGASCIDTELDRNNCGGCGVVCAPDSVCVDGGCTADIPCEPACAAGETCAAGVCQCGAGASCGPGSTCCGGTCAVTLTDPLNCGSCGNSCGGQACCNGLCTDTSTSTNHCGACGNSCGDGADNCAAGACLCGAAPECLFFPCFASMCLLI